MHEYKVETCTIKSAEEQMNTLAKEGWRVIDVTPNKDAFFGLIVTYERQKEHKE